MPNIGLVLSGGFAKGAYQVGVLKAIKDFFKEEPIKYVSASSIGVLNAYSFMLDKLDIAEKMWNNLNFTGFNSFLNNCVRGTYITEAINEIVNGSGELQHYLYSACFNITKVKLDYINLKEVKQCDIKSYLQASVSMPIFSTAIEISGIKYVDGGFIDNIPVQPIMKYPFDYAIVVHFDNNYLFENDYFDSKLIKINFIDNKIVRDSLAFDKNSISYMINAGYEKSMSLFNMIFQKGLDNLDFIYEKIKFINDIRGENKFRLTGDIVINNINKALKKIIPCKIQ